VRCAMASCGRSARQQSRSRTTAEFTASRRLQTTTPAMAAPAPYGSRFLECVTIAAFKLRAFSTSACEHVTGLPERHGLTARLERMHKDLNRRLAAMLIVMGIEIRVTFDPI
jgi:hypothetical protein